MSGAEEAIVDTTSNALADFDIAVSVAEASINLQLADAWIKWNADTDELAVVRQSQLRRFRKEAGDFLELFLEAPVLNLGPRNADLSQVLVSFRIKTGRLLSREDGYHAVEIDLAGRTISFLSSLQKQTVSANDLYAMSYEAGQVAAELMAGNPVGSGAFTIECLFLNLNDVNIVSDFKISTLAEDEQLLRLKITAPSGEPEISPDEKRDFVRSLEGSLATLMGKYFQEKGRRFLVSTTVRPRLPGRDASFIVSDLRFKMTRAPAEQADFPRSLDYLGVVAGGLSMPTDGLLLDNARAKLGSWLTRERIDGRKALAAGVMALRGRQVGALLRRSLDAAIRAEYERMRIENGGQELNGRHPEFKLFSNATVTVGDPAGQITVRSADVDNTYHWTAQEDGDEVTFKLVKSLRLVLSPARSRCYDVSGSCEIQVFRMREVTFGNQKASAVKTVPITGVMVLEAISNRLNCDIRPKLSITMGQEKQEVSGDESNFLVKWFGKNQWDQSQAQGFSDFVRGQIETMLKASCEKINVGFKDFAIIPPAEEVFTFAQPRFSAGGDLLLDIVYRAVRGS